MITIKQIFSGNPYKTYPQLQKIWPEPFKTIAEEVVDEHFQLEKDDPNFDIGGMYLIYKNDHVIGITGYFLYNEEVTEIGLRWHGIIPEERGNNYSEIAMNQVLEQAKWRFPQVTTLIELVPQTEYGIPLEKHFKKLGFNPVGEKEVYDWSEYSWQPYHLNIKLFLEKNIKSKNNIKP